MVFYDVVMVIVIFLTISITLCKTGRYNLVFLIRNRSLILYN